MKPRPARPASEDLLALVRKYETLAALRRERARGEAAAARTTLRALAREFPGALRELDTVTLAEIDRRVAALGDAAEGGPLEPWMEWMIAYHATMRAALYVKGRLARVRAAKTGGPAKQTSLSKALVLQVVDDATRRSGVDVDEDFVRTVARPPHGRLNVAVFERLATTFGAPRDAIWEALFPSRRAGRF